MKFTGLFIGLALIVASFALFFIFSNSNNDIPGQYDEFAKCLTESNLKMYGAYWCPHCQDQKETFGNSWKLVNYIECSLPNNAGRTVACAQAGIQSYPTWELPNGERVLGYQSLEQLSEYSGCNLNSES